MLPLHNGGSQASQQQVERDSGVAHEMREAGEQMREVAGFGEAPPKYEEVAIPERQAMPPPTHITTEEATAGSCLLS